MMRDPYKYFRIEARELVEQLGKGVLDMEKSAPKAELVQRLLRVAHTLKGAARVVKQVAIADLAHRAEDILAPFRDPGTATVFSNADDILRLIDEINAKLAKLAENEPGHGAAFEREQTEESLLSARLDMAEMDALLNGIAQASVQIRSLQHCTQLAGRAHQLVDRLAGIHTTAGSITEELRAVVSGLEGGLSTGLEQLEREAHQLRETAERLRLVPVRACFPSLERVARDVAQTVGNRVTLETRGGDVRLDSQVLGVVQAALVQLIRNAVAHGIEPEAERTAQNKTTDGHVLVDVLRRGNRVRFVCQDDGRGVDLEAIRTLVKSKGLPVAEVEKYGSTELIQLLLRGGLTTAETVSQVSGRGIGLDVVREAAERLHGEVSVRTDVHRGTTVELDVPVSISSLEALIVEAAKTVAAIPLDGVRHTLRVKAQDIVLTPEGQTIVHEGKVIPFVPLARPLDSRPQRSDARAAWTVVVIADGAIFAGIGVDRVIGTANIVLRPLPALAPADPVIAGAFFDAAGAPQIVIAPEVLVQRAAHLDKHSAPAELIARLPILVVDDSLTTRMLEQSILESAGYEVDLVVSAEEALERAAHRRYGVYLVDIEMPGMDGYAFVERTRLDPELSQVPAILVSSRDSAEDRQRGQDVGALAFITKGKFDQTEFLNTIKRAMG